MAKLKSIIDYIKNNKNQQIDVKELIYNHNEFFLLIPLFAFVIVPIYYIFIDIPFNLDDPFNGFFNYNYTVNYIIYLSAIVGPAAIAIHFWKQKKDSIKFSIKDYIPMVFFALLCILMLISTFINGFTSYVIHGNSYRGESLLSFIVYFAVMYFCGTLITKDSYKKLILAVFLISNLIVNAIQLIHIYIKPLQFFEYSDSDAPSAIFYQFNHYGYFLMLAIMISAGIISMSKNIKYKIFAAFLLILNTFILSLNTTFGCFLACLIGMVFLVIVSSVVERKFNVISVFALGIFIAVTFITGLKYHSFIQELGRFFKDIESVMGDVSESTQAEKASESAGAADSAGTGRWGLWRFTMGYIKQKPIFGWGVEGISEMLTKDSNGLNNRPHNEYLQYAAFFGIPAAITYISGVAAHFIKALKTRKSFSPAAAICLVAAFTYLVSAFFGNTMFYTAPYLFIFMGLATGSENKNIV